MVIRKTSQRIKEEILSYLDKQPLSVEQLRKNIEDSNWATVNKHLEELKIEGEVREIISTEKIKIYQRVVKDTYFNLPITNEQRKKFRTLFSMIVDEYKKQRKNLTKTHIAKCAVYVIDNKESGLNDLPIVWYLYGMMPLMAVDVNANYKEEFALECKTKIKNLIIEFVKENGEKGSIQIEQEQHRRYNDETYVLSDEIFKMLNEPEINNQKFNELLGKFFIVCPIDSEFPKIFDLTEKVISIMQKMILLDLDIKDYRKEIILTFDSLWKFIALYKLYKSITEGPNSMNKELVLNFYLGGAIEDRERVVNESLSEINSFYLTNLIKFDINKIKLSDEVKEIRKITEDWTGED